MCEERNYRVPLREGTEASVFLGEEPDTVVKVFRDTRRRPATEAAKREYVYLQRLYNRLQSNHMVSVPQPISLELIGGQPRVVMSRVPANNIRSLIRSGQFSRDIDTVGQALAEAVALYCEEFNETWYDCALRNTLLQWVDGRPIVSIVDFGVPYVPEVRGEPIDISAGIMLGQAAKDAIGPRAFIRETVPYKRVTPLSLALCRSVIRHLPAPDPDTIYESAYATYFRRMPSRGLKRWYFSSAWMALVKRQVSRAVDSKG